MSQQARNTQAQGAGVPRAPRAPRDSYMVQTIAFLLSGGLLLWVWTAAAQNLSPLVLPGPADTWNRLLQLLRQGAVVTQLLISVRRLLAGFGLAYLAALVLGIAMHRFAAVRYILQPWLAAVQMVPTVITLVLAVIWFGIARDKTPIFVVFVVCLPVVLVQIREGLASLPAELLDLAALDPMNVFTYARHVAWPALRPFLLSAASLGFSFAWRAVVFAEFVASNSGLGYQLSRAYHNLATDEVFAWAIVLVALMWGWQGLVGRWRE